MGEEFRMGAKSLYQIRVGILQSVAPQYPKCTISQTMES